MPPPAVSPLTPSFQAGRLEEALADADRTVVAKPDWGKGYFRRGMALSALGQPEDALVAFFQCLVLEESCSRALRTEIYKVDIRYMYRYIR